MLEVAGLCISRDLVSHPLLGNAHVIEHAGRPLTAMSRIDWDRPTTIPTIADPARLPPNTGTALLNEIAIRARAAGVTALRYGGPYPTPALYRSLLRSFRASAPEEAFTAGVLDRAIRLVFDEIPVDFAPAPHARIAITRGFVELRDGLERAVIDDVSYEPEGSPARLAGDAAEIWFGDAPYARIARFAPTGELLDGPHAPPPCTSSVIGREFPPELRGALAELVADLVPAPLASDARDFVARTAMHWADLGARAARITTGLELHAAIWDRIAPLGLPRLALAIAEALAPIVTRAVLADVIRVRANRTS